jgi:hypothetical protein
MKMEYSLDDWVKTKPEPLALDQKDIDEVHRLMDAVGAKIESLGTSFTFSMVTRIDGLGSGQLQSRMSVTPGTLTPEMWVGQFIATGGMDNLLENMGALISAANDRLDNTKTLSLILPPTSILL